MKGYDEIITTLNKLLEEELTAISQYMLHAEMCNNWGYEKLHQVVEKRAIKEMAHAEKLIARILFLEGTPIVGNLRNIHIGKNVKEQLENDHGLEIDAVKEYNDAIQEAVELKDNGTRELLESILRDEEEHIDTLETHLEQIRQIGLQNFLTKQMA